MSTRAFQARIDCDRETLDALWRTHRVFNDRLPSVLSLLFRMRRGECGRNAAERDLYKRIGHFITGCSSQNADYLLNSVSVTNWRPATAKKIKSRDESGATVTGESWADDAATLSARCELLFNKDELHGDLPGCMRQMLNRESVAIISGHDELVTSWERDHAAWLSEKAVWEEHEEHKRYLAIRSKFELFETSVGGKVAKRRGRWGLYLEWLRDNPDLAAWRGGEAIVNDLSSESLARVRAAKPWKQRSVEAEEFWRINPELAALDRLHGQYEREFVRRRKTKRNRDGFDHRPTFTQPKAVIHPRWFVFNAPQTNPSGYRHLAFPSRVEDRGGVELLLLTGDKGEAGAKIPAAWTKVAFRVDPRLTRTRSVKVSTTVNRGRNKGLVKTRNGFEFLDPHLKMWRPAEISGAKLIFRRIRRNDDGTLRSAVAYLVFACTIADLPLTEAARKIEWSETDELTRAGKRRKQRKLPEGLVACAVDLGLRHVGFATMAVCERDAPRVLRSRNIWLEAGGGGPDLAHIGRHKRALRRLRRLRGKPVHGEQSHAELQNHITHMGEDRFKKAARAIVNFAWNTDGALQRASGEPIPRADVIIIEKLAGFIPDAERERGVNRALAAWNRGQLVDRLKEIAIDAGYKGRVFEVHPAGTSQVCSRCGELGRRYSIARAGGQPDIRFGWVETLFACPACGYRANSDHNASVNLHRRFFLGEPAVAAFFGWRNQTEAKRRELIACLEERLRDQLRRLHRLPPFHLDFPHAPTI